MSGPTGYLILSHRDPKHVGRLAEAIVEASPRAHVLVAHDARRDTGPQVDHPRVRVWEHGARTDWGSWDLVHVTLEGLARLHDWADPEVVGVVSGQDYLCADLSAWERAFAQGGGGWVGSASPLHYTPRWGRRRGTGDDTWTRYHYRWYDVPNIDVRFVPARAAALAARARDGIFLRVEPALSYRVMERAGRKLVGVRVLRGVPATTGARSVFKGQQMLAMDSVLLRTVLKECVDDSPLVKHFARTVIPDESLIQTVLARQVPPRSDLSFSFVRWDQETDGSAWLDVSDLPAIQASGAVFCRKVRTDDGSALADALDEVRQPPGRGLSRG